MRRGKRLGSTLVVDARSGAVSTATIKSAQISMLEMSFSLEMNGGSTAESFRFTGGPLVEPVDPDRFYSFISAFTSLEEARGWFFRFRIKASTLSHKLVGREGRFALDENGACLWQPRWHPDQIYVRPDDGRE